MLFFSLRLNFFNSSSASFGGGKLRSPVCERNEDTTVVEAKREGMTLRKSPWKFKEIPPLSSW